ncbi:MAG: squalene/phytoene synthase family protein, partial [Acidobacteriota bacterium]|nr:squalene/phytoene synthase family protein [Acidobacteriota bacterium]
MRPPWDERQWRKFEEETARAALNARSDAAAWAAIARQARIVLRAYSTSFFLVTRFLPPEKRARVEAVYAAVRYPDEIVDSFPLDRNARANRLDAWRADYGRAL